jgi:ABC-type sulfate/molybdate transport systems ATPase subunit
VNKLLAMIQLPDIARRYPTQLSGGQRQRVALARALAIEPRMLLLDEPFGALDARVRKELRAGLREIHDQTGLTTVFVTHDQDEAMELADLVVVMSMGRIEQIGTPQDVRSRPPRSSCASSSRRDARAVLQDRLTRGQTRRGASSRRFWLRLLLVATTSRWRPDLRLPLERST